MIKTADPSRGQATYVRYLVLLWLCAAATIAYIHRGCISVPAAQIQDELSLTDNQMSWVMSAFFWSYALCQLPTGWLGDRWGSRLSLSVYSATWSAATGCMGFVSGFAGLVGSRCANGIAQAGLFPASVSTVSKWFPVSQRAFPSGMLGSFMSVGAAIASLLTGFLLSYLSWHTVFVSLSLLGFIWSVGFHWWFRDLPEEHPWVNDAECELIREGSAVEDSSPAADEVPAILWATLLTSPQMLCICGQQVFRAVGYVFYQTWFPTYLQKARGVSIAKSGYLTSLPLVGIVAGSLLGGAISDWILIRTGSRRLSRQGVAVAGLSGCALFILAAYFVADPTQAALIIALGSFCSGIAAPAAYTITMDLGGRYVSTVFGTMNMAGNIGAAMCPLAVTWLVTTTDQNWDLVLLLFVAVYVAAACCWIFLDTECGIFPATGEE